MKNINVKIFDHLECKLKPNQKITLPLLVSEGKVIEKWIDYNGHMNMAYYVQCFEESCDYILELLSDIYNDDISSKDNIEKKKQDILNIISGESNLRSKKELIESFIENNLPKIKQKKDIKTNFNQYWNQEKERALAKIRDEENMVEGNLKPIIENYIFSGIEPSRNEMIDAITKDKQPKILERKKVATRIMSKIKEFINIFEN